MLEPLGHSQVLNYLKLLSKEFSFFIISFEKKNDLKNKKNFNYVNNLIENHNIYWEKIVYSKNYFLEQSTMKPEDIKKPLQSVGFSIL